MSVIGFSRVLSGSLLIHSAGFRQCCVASTVGAVRWATTDIGTGWHGRWRKSRPDWTGRPPMNCQRKPHTSGRFFRGCVPSRRATQTEIDEYNKTKKQEGWWPTGVFSLAEFLSFFCGLKFFFSFVFSLVCSSFSPTLLYFFLCVAASLPSTRSVQCCLVRLAGPHRDSTSG